VRESFGERTDRKIEKFWWWVLLPLVAAGAVVIGASIIRYAWPAVEGRGTVGTFVARELQCSSGKGGTFCTWQGDFTADDGTVHLTSVLLEGAPHGLEAGGTAVAVYTGDRGTVIGKGNQAHFVFGVVLFVGGVAWLIGYLVVAFRRYRSRKEVRRWQQNRHAHDNLR
jgi:hypothetical protein